MRKDESAVRAFFLNPAGRWVRICIFTCFVLCQVLLCFVKHFALVNTVPVRLGTALLFTVPLALMLFFFFQERKEASLTELLLGGGICLMAMLMRLCFIDRDTGDFEYYLRDWLRVLSGQSFGASMRMQVGEYHVLYQYILFVITRLPLPELYSVKAVSFIGDAFLAGAAFRLFRTASSDDRQGNLPLLVLLLPAVAINGGMFAQCDSLYTAASLWGLALILQGKPERGMACMGISLCFKLQAVFLFPVLPLFWLSGRIRIRDLFWFLLAVLIVQLPALFGGKAPSDLLAVYTGQIGLYTGLNYGAPNLWALITSDGLDAYAYGTFGISLAMAACFLVFGSALRRKNQLGTEAWLGTAALMVLLVVFCLPRMHERYTYSAELLVCIYAMCDSRALPAAVAVSFANLSALWLTAVPLSGCALLMLGAIVHMMYLLFAKPVSPNH